MIWGENAQAERLGTFHRNLLTTTDSLEEVQKFLDNIQLKNIKTFDDGYYYTNDLASGYHAVLDRIRWDKNSEKIVIHLCNSPTYGQYYTIDPKRKDLMKVPKFDPDIKLDENAKIYDNIQTKQNNWLMFLIRRLVEEGIQLYCLNNREIDVFCLNEIKKKYDSVGGKKCLIKNIFGSNNLLNEQLTQFTLDIIKSLSNNSYQVKFELEINERFKNDCDKFRNIFPENQYSNKIKKLKKTITNLENSISTAKSLIHDQINSIQNTSKISICDMVEQTLKKYNELNTLVGKIKKNNNHYNNDNIQQLKEEVQNIKSQKSLVSELCTKYKLKNQNSEAKIEYMKSQIQKLQDEIQSTKIENSTVINKFNEVQTENKCLHDQIEELRNMMDQYKKNITLLNEKNIDLHRKNRILKKILIKESEQKE